VTLLPIKPRTHPLLCLSHLDSVSFRNRILYLGPGGPRDTRRGPVDHAGTTCAFPCPTSVYLEVVRITLEI
jgi:hypothetical protein